MTEREALKMALEALKGYRRELNDDQPCDAEQDIEKLLAQPEQEPSCAECGAGGGHALYCVACAEKFVGGYKEQEPVAFLTNRRQRLNVEFNATGFTLMPKSVDWKIPLYTTPPQTNAYDNMLKAIDSMRPAARVIKDKPATWWLDEFEKVVRNLKENNT